MSGPTIDLETLTSDTEPVRCCCGGSFNMARDVNGDFAVLHTEPACALLMNTEVEHFLVHQRRCPNGWAADYPEAQSMFEGHDGPDGEPLCSVVVRNG